VAKQKDKDRGSSAKAGRADAVRSAVNEAFTTTAEQSAAAAEQGREAAQDIVDQLAQAAGRVRDVLDDLRPPTGDDLKAIRSSLAALERRVAALEAAQQTAAPPAARKAPAKRAATARRSTPGQSKS
jgi:polyhydroxyalkanoate synthesis regulator phasin